MSIDYSKPRPSKGGSPSGAPVSLTKRGQTVNLSKGSSGRPVRVNLNWNQQPTGGSGGGGFLKRLSGGSSGIDLDLGCLFELTDGSKGVVQALGNGFGNLDGPPFVKLDKDDRSGTATDGENLFISGQHSGQIKRLAVFAFIYEGVKNWSQADAKITIHPAEGGPVEIQLNETRDGTGMCAVCLITGSPDGFGIERRVEYLGGHRDIDKLFGWGLRWSAGSK